MTEKLWVALVLVCTWPRVAAANDCTVGPSPEPRRPVIERIHPSLLIGWTFDRYAAGFIGLDVSYTHQSRATFGGYASALLLSDHAASARTPQLSIGGILAPWTAPQLYACDTVPIFDPRPIGRIGYLWRAGNLDVDSTSFAQVGASASVIVGLAIALAIPVSPQVRGHRLQPMLALSLSVPVIIGQRAQ